VTYDLRQAIRDHLSEADSPADPHEIAEVLLAEIPPHEVRSCLGLLLSDAVRESIRAHRAPSRGSGKNGRRDLGRMTLDPTRMRRFVPGFGWKFEADLSADDCDAVADHYFSLALANEVEGKRWRATADRLRQEALDCVGDLDDGAVAA